MSCDWNVHCLDCKATNYFGDANHRDDLMSLLCKHAAAIAALAPLIAEERYCIELRTSYGDIDPAWFAMHLGHRLVPIDEYGRVLGQCDGWFPNGIPCVLDEGHEGPHQPREETL